MSNTCSVLKFSRKYLESDFFQIYFSFTIGVLTMICNLCKKKKNDHDDNQLGVKARESGIWEETLYYAYHSEALVCLGKECWNDHED